MQLEDLPQLIRLSDKESDCVLGGEVEETIFEDDTSRTGYTVCYYSTNYGFYTSCEPYINIRRAPVSVIQ